MQYNIAIDADSMADIALHRTGTQKLNFLEEAYLEFCGQIKDVHSGIFRRYRYQQGDSVNYIIALSPKQSWRNRYVPTYKSNRDERSPEKTELLNLIYQRLGERVIFDNNVEADDIVMWYASQGYMMAAIDKDIGLACETPTFDYKKKKWIEPKDFDTIERNIVMQSVMGDSVDGIKGAFGKGEVFCKENILQRRSLPYLEWVSWFASEEEAIESMRLVRMDQWTPEGGLQMWQPGNWKL